MRPGQESSDLGFSVAQAAQADGTPIRSDSGLFAQCAEVLGSHVGGDRPEAVGNGRGTGPEKGDGQAVQVGAGVLAVAVPAFILTAYLMLLHRHGLVEASRLIREVKAHVRGDSEANPAP